MFGIAWPELLVIGVVAVVVIGPKDLPVLMRNIGRWSRKARLMVDDFKQHWDDLPSQTGMSEMQRQADEIQRQSYLKFGINPDQLTPPMPEKPPEQAEPPSAKPKDPTALP